MLSSHYFGYLGGSFGHPFLFFAKKKMEFNLHMNCFYELILRLEFSIGKISLIGLHSNTLDTRLWFSISCSRHESET
jgi:hypothetical protein